MTNQQLTIKAVLAYANDLRIKADATLVRDIYAKPYRPTDAAVTRLSQTCVKARLLALEPEAEEQDRADARALGYSDAKAVLAWRAIDAEAAYRADKLASEHKDQKHRKVQLKAQRDRDARRAGVSIGARIDNALRALSTVSGIGASNLEGDIVTGSKERQVVSFVDDPAAKAKAIAERAMREIENEVEDARRRRVELEAA